MTQQVYKKSSKRDQRDRTLERSCDEAILNTIKYRSIFKSSVSFNQLGTYLVSDCEIDYPLFKTRTKNLLKSNKIKVKKSKFHVPGNKPLSWDLRAKYSKELLDRCHIAFELLKKIKWIKLLSVTGSVAAYNAKKRDDIDIFIITEEKRLWLTRGFVFLVLKAINMYPKGNNFNEKICPNIFIDETKMVWDESKRNIFIAHDILMMHPIINREDTYFKFIKSNDWVFDHFGGFAITLDTKHASKGPYKSKIVDFMEFLSMSVQLWYMKKRKTTEVTTQSFIHFNKYDHTEKILKEYESLIV